MITPLDTFIRLETVQKMGDGKRGNHRLRTKFGDKIVSFSFFYTINLKKIF